MHAVETYVSVRGEGHADLHVCVGPQSATGWGKAGRAEMSLRALELGEKKTERMLICCIVEPDTSLKSIVPKLHSNF